MITTFKTYIQTTIRILPLSAVVGTGKIARVSDYDEDAYNRIMLNPMGNSVFVCKAFDAYRTLKSTLEDFGVYCADKDALAKAASDPDAICVDAVFPKTYAKSTVGFGLSETELRDRCVLYYVLRCYSTILMSHSIDCFAKRRNRHYLSK